jgi:hypothetical protein
LINGSKNIAVGSEAGLYLDYGSNNIYIGNNGPDSGTEIDIIRIGTQGVQTVCFLAGTVYANGTFVSSCDRNAKENFKTVVPQQVLEKVAALPVSRWNYKQDTTSEHIGPMAQDFYAAFNVGPDDKHITTVDEGGVALAAIQGLNQKVDEKEARSQEQALEIKNLKQKNDRLAARLNELEAAVRAFTEKK